MSNIRGKIYHDVYTGQVLVYIPEQQDTFGVRETTVEEDFESLKVLNERVRESVGVITLDFGQYAQDFAEAIDYRVNIDTQKLEFKYPDPNNPGVDQPYQAPLSEQIVALEKENKLFRAQNEALTDKTNFHDDVLTEIILAINS